MNKFCGVLILTLLTIYPIAGLASLGGTETSVGSDTQSLKAVHTREQSTTYSVHTLTTATGTICEYATSAGVVFAVSWRGMARPDLSTLLGAYYAEYSQADSQIKTQIKKVHGRHATVVKSANVVVSRGGHMRDIHGKAYSPALVPSGVNVENLP